MVRSMTAAALLLAVSSSAILAGERKLFENVKGWEVEQNLDQHSAQSCQISYSYKDKDDKDAENVVVVALDGQKLLLAVGYENWEWDADEKVTAPIRADKQMLFAKQGWIGKGKVLKTQLPDSVTAKFSKAKQIILEIGDGTADFDIPDFADAFASMKRCNTAFDPSTAKTVAAPPRPSEDRAFAYGVGLYLQNLIGKCEINTTAKQRAAVDAKLASLKPEMAPFETKVQDDLKKPDAAPCPADKAETEAMEIEIRSFAELSPEEFTVAFNRRAAENEARDKAAAEAKAATEAEARMRAEIETKMRAEAEAKAKAAAETKARTEMEARIRSEVEAKLRAEADAKAALKTEADAKGPDEGGSKP